jgi:acetyltransferase-like isoleucine patch superfamily enzyme
MKKIIICILLFVFPVKYIRLLLNFLGCKIGKKVTVGFNFIYVNNLILDDNSFIRSFNFINIENLTMKERSYINYFNIIKGPLDVLLNKKAAIGKRNQITRGRKGVVYGKAILSLGILSKITSNHFLDLTRSISFGDYSTLAGVRSQLWTHGYVHADRGPERFRVDGEITFGDNVYIGSNSFSNPGIKVSDRIHIGGNSSISKDLTESGMYVNQGLRYINISYEEIKNKMTKLKVNGLVDDVYER